MDKQAHEARRIELAKKAANHPAALAAHKAAIKALHEHREAMKAQRLRDEETTRLLERAKAATGNASTATGNDLEALIQHAGLDGLRRARKVAESAAASAAIAAEDARKDLAAATAGLHELRRRVASIPSPASGADLRASLRAEEEALAPLEARALAKTDEAKSAAESARVAVESFAAALAAALKV